MDPPGLISFSLRTEVKGAYGDWGEMRALGGMRRGEHWSSRPVWTSWGMKTKFEQEGVPSQEGYGRIP